MSKKLFFTLVALNLVISGVINENSAEDHFDQFVNIPKLAKENFEQALDEPELGTFVLFYAPWCGHCKAVMGTWSNLQRKHLKMKKFSFAKVDCIDQTELCSDNDVLAYPT
jgi:protein disulfide-isomerase A1